MEPALAKDRFKTSHASPWLAWVTIGVLLLAVVGLVATYALRPAPSPGDEARTAAAVSEMDEAQSQADERRDEERSATSLL
jgi:hypothetical protein